MRELDKYNVLSLTHTHTYRSLQLVSLPISALCLHFLHIDLLGLLLLPLVALLSPLVLKLQTDLSVILLLF